MLRWPRPASIAIVALLISVGCTTRPKVIVDAPQASVAPAPVVDESIVGVAMVAQPYNQYLFAPPDLIANRVQAPPMVVQAATVRLQGSIEKHERLDITPLPSTRQTVALGLQETAAADDVWGEVLTPVLRGLFQTFADDPSYGDWLIVVDDVIVLGGPDGVPLTAYRWPRSVVEAYSTCGIPPDRSYGLNGLDPCTSQFYLDGEEVYLIRSGQNVGQ
jgi:hypothetical protein